MSTLRKNLMNGRITPRFDNNFIKALGGAWQTGILIISAMFIMSKFKVKIANADAEAVIEKCLDALEAMSIERSNKFDSGRETDKRISL